MSNDKPWDKPLSPQEIVNNAADWTLAHDVGLLKYLEQFSEKLLKDANDTNDNLDNLLNNLENASLSLDIARNTFMSLSNVQFIEKRVYDDDETLPTVEKTEPIEKRQTEDERIDEMKAAVLRGLNIVDKYFDKVEVVASDSEDDTDFPCFVLQPKDPYINRPLPYIIGSEKWHAKLHVGLAESSDESDGEKASEKYSDSDLESDLPTTNRSQVKTASESGSDDLCNGIRQPVANSTFNGATTTTDLLGSNGDDFDSAAQRALISQNNFAAQLTAKLDSVIGKNVSAEPEINKKPIQKPSTYNYDLFSNEPPPLHVVDERQSKNHGLFSGGDGLFDNLDDDESFWGEKTIHQKTNDVKPIPNLFDDDHIDDVPSAIVTKNQSQSKRNGTKLEDKKIDDLFDDDSDDDLFTGVQRSVKLDKPYLRASNIPTVPLGDEEPPNLDDVLNSKPKAPIGGKLPFGNVNLLTGQHLEGILNDRRRRSDVDDQTNQTTKPIDKPAPNESKALSNDDLFGTINPNQSKRKTIGLFDDDSFGDIFNDTPKEFVSGLFEDVRVEPCMERQAATSSLFSSSIDKSKHKDSLFSDDDFEPDDDLFSFNKITRKAKNQTKPKGLFDEDDEDLFVTAVKPKSENSTKKSVDLMSSSKDEVADGKQKLEPTDLFPSNEDATNAFGPIIKDNELNLDKSAKRPSYLRISNELEENDDRVVAENNSTVRQLGETGETRSNFEPKSEVVIKRDMEKGLVAIADEIKETYLGDKQDRPRDVVASNDDLFAEKAPKSTEKSIGNNRDKMSPTNEEKQTRRESNKLADTQIADSTKSSKDIFEDLFSTEPPSKTVDLFDDSFLFSNDYDDLFAFGDAKKTQQPISNDVNVPNINLFDPVPPPDLDNWDVRSENNLFDDDPFSFENDDVAGHRSSIFDNEPPSLLYNESSGIVRDQASRVETDDSSFDPYASSSRRFSTDNNDEIFSDNFFVTKTLDDIPEVVGSKSDSAVSYVDVTPSGIIDDLYSESPSRVEQSIIDHGSSKIDDETSAVADLSKLKPKIGEKPKVSPISQNKKDDNGRHVQTEEIEDNSIGSPGKLKHNLNINVQALLPGAAPPRRPALAKSQSLDLARQEVVPAHEAIAERNEESPVADGAAKDATKTVEVLQSVTKDRARIAVKRRPSTRKGREAIRKSCIDFTFDPTHEENDNSVERTDPIQVENQTPIIPELASRTEPIVTPTDENEIKPVVGINAFAEKSKSTNLFSESDDDDDLFANVKPKPKMEPAVKKPDFLSVDEAKFDGARRTSFVKTDNFETPDMKSDLFDEDDDDKDIFSAKRLPPKSDFLNRNMFDDEDDDLFWSNSTTVTKTAKRTDLKAVEKKPKTTVAKKLENVEVLFDPLNAMKE